MFLVIFFVSYFVINFKKYYKCRGVDLIERCLFFLKMFVSNKDIFVFEGKGMNFLYFGYKRNIVF